MDFTDVNYKNDLDNYKVFCTERHRKKKRKHFSHTKVIMQKNIRRTVAEENDLQ